MLIQLPNGLLDGVDLFNYCEIDELRGRQQNYLANSQLVINNIGHVPKILGDMVLSFQTKEGLTWKGKIADGVNKIPSGDIEAILIKVRENTYGPKFFHEAICSHCGHHHKDLKLDLSTLTIDSMSVEEMMKPKKLVLPKSQLEIELKPIQMKDLFTAIKLNTDGQDKLVTESIKLSIKSINNSDTFTSKDVENIPVSDLQFLSKESEQFKLEGTIDTNIEITCINCEKDFSVRLNPLKPDFFSPTGGSLSLNT
jgi:hypothetical protein